MRNNDVVLSILPPQAFKIGVPEQLDLLRDQDFILANVFEKGKWEEVLLITALYGVNTTAEVLRRDKELGPFAFHLAYSLFYVELFDYACYRRGYMGLHPFLPIPMKGKLTNGKESISVDIEEAIVKKIDGICCSKHRQFYTDIANLLDQYPIAQMLGFYQKRFPGRDTSVLIPHLLDVEGLENSLEPAEFLDDEVLYNSWNKMVVAVKQFATECLAETELKEQERLRNIRVKMNIG